MKQYDDYEFDDLMDGVNDLLGDEYASGAAWDDDFDLDFGAPQQEQIWRNAANGYGCAPEPDYGDAPEDQDYDEEVAAMRYDPRTNSGSAIKAYNTDYASRAASRARKHKAAPPPRRSTAADGDVTRQISAEEMRRIRQAPRPKPAAQEPVYYTNAQPQSVARNPKSRRPQQPVRTAQFEDVPEYPKKKRKKKHGLLKFLLFLLILLALAVAALWLFAREPDSAGSLSVPRDGSTAILLAGTDEGGARTDTMMLLYLDEQRGQMNLLSLPRDTYTTLDTSVPKLNSVYGIYDGGKEGMEALLDYTAECIGYRPDGYVLIDLDCFESLVNLMGGVRFNVPCDMYYEDPSQDLYIDLKEGEQKLSGEEAMWVVRYRSGYALADLQRVQVQRDFIQAAMTQWLTLGNIWKAPAAAALITANTTTDLSVRELAWLAKTARTIGTGNMQTDTLPGEASYVGDGSYYIIWPETTAGLINEFYNPYDEDVSPDSIYSPFY